jgi:hypothetical protein
MIPLTYQKSNLGGTVGNIGHLIKILSIEKSQLFQFGIGLDETL